MTLYYRELKMFFRGQSGYDYQTADLGTVPMLYTNMKKCKAGYDSLVNTFCDIYGYEKQACDQNIKVSGMNLLERAVLHRGDGTLRAIISMYEVETRI